MKKTIILLSLMLISITSFTQTEIPGSNEDMTKKIIERRIKIIKETAFIFEGTVIKTVGFFGKNHAIYTSNTVQINKIFRGNGLKLGTIEVITEGGTVQTPDDKRGLLDRSGFPSHGGISFGPGYSGLFFCSSADSNLIVLPLTTDNTIRTKYWDCISTSDNDYGISGMNLSFKSYNELYTYLKKTGNLTVLKEAKQPAKKTEEQPVQLTPAQKAEADSIKQAQEEQRQKNAKRYMEERKKIIDAQKKKEGK